MSLPLAAKSVRRSYLDIVRGIKGEEASVVKAEEEQMHSSRADADDASTCDDGDATALSEPSSPGIYSRMQLLLCSPLAKPCSFSPRCSRGWSRPSTVTLPGSDEAAFIHEDSLPCRPSFMRPRAETAPACSGLAPPPGLLPPPGLSPPPGLELPAADSLHKEKEASVYQVLLTGVPEPMTHELMLRAVLDQANLEQGLVEFSTRPGGKVLLSFESIAWVKPCLLHFNGCHWAGSNARVTARFVYTVRSTPSSAKVAVAEPAKVALTAPSSPALRPKASMSGDAPVFVPMLSMTSAGAAPSSPVVKPKVSMSHDTPVFVPMFSMMSADAPVFEPKRGRNRFFSDASTEDSGRDSDNISSGDCDDWETSGGYDSGYEYEMIATGLDACS